MSHTAISFHKIEIDSLGWQSMFFLTVVMRSTALRLFGVIKLRRENTAGKYSCERPHARRLSRLKLQLSTILGDAGVVLGVIDAVVDVNMLMPRLWL